MANMTHVLAVGAKASMSDLFQMYRHSGPLPWTLMSSWLNSSEAQLWLHRLENYVDWERPVVRIYGREHFVPRLTAFLAADGVTYCYSGVQHCGEGWPVWFIPLLEKVNEVSAVNFNGCLLNLYRNGLDRMGWHADDEAELDPKSPIASLSVGATRDFCLKHRQQPLRELLCLRSGDLLIMHPECQQEWLHALPTRRRVAELRINLTFRCFIKGQGA